MNTDKNYDVVRMGKKNSWLWDEETLRNDALNRVVPLEEIDAHIEKMRAAGWFKPVADLEMEAPGLFPALRRVLRQMFRK